MRAESGCTRRGSENSRPREELRDPDTLPPSTRDGEPPPEKEGLATEGQSTRRPQQTAMIRGRLQEDFRNVLGLGEEQLEHREAVSQALVIAEQQDGRCFLRTLEVRKDEHSPKRQLVA